MTVSESSRLRLNKYKVQIPRWASKQVECFVGLGAGLFGWLLFCWGFFIVFKLTQDQRV